jgi:A/G-specific adenine glycosylase
VRQAGVPLVVNRVELAAFVARVARSGRKHYRDLPWRTTRDSYAVLLSEVMLQQTQVARVAPKYLAWLEAFPTLAALAAAPLEPVLEAWQGLGYNRRAVALKRTAEQVCERHQCRLPADESELRLLPGIGPSTAAGVLVFAHDLPAVYLETNVRSVFLHELFADRVGVKDSEIEPLARLALGEALSQGIGPRDWSLALLDHGAHLKQSLPNPSRRSAHHTRQSAFEGSRRQKRAWLLRAVIADAGLSAEEYASRLAAAEQGAGREAPSVEDVAEILGGLAAEGFLVREGDAWAVA